MVPLPRSGGSALLSVTGKSRGWGGDTGQCPNAVLVPKLARNQKGPSLKSKGTSHLIKRWKGASTRQHYGTYRDHGPIQERGGFERRSGSGPKRRFDPLPATSGLPQTTDIIRSARLVRLVPTGDIARLV